MPYEKIKLSFATMDAACSCRNQSGDNGATKNRRKYVINLSCLSSTVMSVLVLGIISLPSGICAPHISSVLESGDGVPGLSMKPLHRGPTVAPLPSQETLKQLELLQTNGEDGDGDDDETSFFNPTEAIRNFLTFSSFPHRVQGLKRVSQFHGYGTDGNNGPRRGGSKYRAGNNDLPSNLLRDYEDDMHQIDDDGQPTFVPYIGARALTNIPQFFEHLKENIEALKLGPSDEIDDEENNILGGGGSISDGGDEDDDSVGEVEERLPKKDMTKPAARRMKTEFHVDENLGHSTPMNGDGSKSTDAWTSTKQNWKPHAAGIIHYYVPKANLESQHILRRANNYNPAWLYTNLGLGKKRRR